MRNATITVFVSALLAFCSAAALADDSDIFLKDDVPPNVVILLDSSGSMDNKINGVRKIDSAKAVVSSLVENIEGVNFGLFKFNSSSSGGHMVFPVGTDKDTMLDRIAGIGAGGWTPLGRATIDVQDYYINGYREMVCIDCPATWDDETAEREGTYVSVVRPGPIEYECQKNYAILVTDGLPNGEPENLVADTALDMFTSDHSTLPGTQNIIVHTVGFDVPEGADLLTRTADNGGGTFYTASSATQLEAALQDAISQIIQDQYSFTIPLVPSQDVSGGDLAYFASFKPDPLRPFWEGYLKAYTKDADGNVPTDDDGLPLESALAWDAGKLLAERSPSTRTIYTAVSDTLEMFTRTNSDITPELLDVSGVPEKAKLISFIRGTDTYDDDFDGNTTENREWILGDIFHASPVLVFPPPLRSTDSSYISFKEANKDRTVILLAASNDGMLHAFQASDGVELWAFIAPNDLNELKLLTNRIGSHPYYVDLTPYVVDIKVGSNWKTIVVFGQRRGGTSYHALDITDTTNPSFLWSFTDSDIEESWSEPAIGKIKMADDSVKFVAFVGGGYDTPDNNLHGRAVYAIDLATGDKLWEYKGGGLDDSQYLNFSLAGAPTAVDYDWDGYIDRVYAADVGGQLWKFDTSAPATTTGGLIDNWAGKRLFAADPDQDNPPAAGEYYPAQAMYGAPAVSLDYDNNLWVFIGTGDRNHPKAASSNRFYGIKDTTDMTNDSTLTESDLVDATTSDAVTQGWYRPLAANEKVLAAAKVFNGVVYFTTFTPVSTDLCDSSAGDAQLYAVQLASGDAAIDWDTGAKLPETTEGDEDDSEDIGGGIPTEPDVVLGDDTDTVVVGTTDQEVETLSLPTSRTKAIRYWREVY